MSNTSTADKLTFAVVESVNGDYINSFIIFKCLNPLKTYQTSTQLHLLTTQP